MRIEEESAAKTIKVTSIHRHFKVNPYSGFEFMRFLLGLSFGIVWGRNGVVSVARKSPILFNKRQQRSVV